MKKELIKMSEMAQEIYNDGRQQEKMDTARRMLREGAAVDFVVKCTQLPIDEVEALKRDLT
ncbi:hypothetical protein [Alicyclobacillus fodiniaquatilis]|uniref:Transposase n=1 Tax=Alicyclobacillus fodiniaquatilis TaxID=1661150 RepID=A0ABW4JLQ8_9BACL